MKPLSITTTVPSSTKCSDFKSDPNGPSTREYFSLDFTYFILESFHPRYLPNPLNTTVFIQRWGLNLGDTLIDQGGSLFL